MIVVLLMGIVAASVIPAMSNVQAMREGAARDDVARLLEMIKARAMATGVPTGLHVDLGDSSLAVVRLSDAGAIETLVDPLTLRDRTIVLPSQYSGVTVSQMTNGDGVQGSGTVWFDYESAPHTRMNDGGFEAMNSEAVIITLSSGNQVIVHAHSGVVETP